jgi:hypothetical protein
MMYSIYENVNIILLFYKKKRGLSIVLFSSNLRLNLSVEREIGSQVKVDSSLKLVDILSVYFSIFLEKTIIWIPTLQGSQEEWIQQK